MISNCFGSPVWHNAPIPTRSAFKRNFLLTNCTAFWGEHDAGTQIPLIKLRLRLRAKTPLQDFIPCFCYLLKCIKFLPYISRQSKPSGCSIIVEFGKDTATTKQYWPCILMFWCWISSRKSKHSVKWPRLNRFPSRYPEFIFPHKSKTEIIH